MRKLHRSLAWLAGLAAIAWAATGFLHPIMSWTAPRAAIQAPPQTALPMADYAAPGPALAAAGVQDVRAVRLTRVDGQAYWLAAPADGGAFVAVNAATGARADVEQAHTEMLARHYAGLGETEIVSARRITAFSQDYPSINRLLPVWELRFATSDGLTIYVDPMSDRLAAVSNTPRRLMLAVFQNVHTMRWLAGAEPLRRALITLLIGSVIVTALAGAIMSFRARGVGLRLVHRTLGVGGLIFALSFGGSGLFHLHARENAPLPSARAFNVAALTGAPLLAGGPVMRLASTASANGAPVWRADIAGAGLYFDAQGRALLLNDAAHARSLASAAEGANVTPVQGFTNEYGFANKRLPVFRVAGDQGASFVDLIDSVVAARPRGALASTEAWSFDTIHKWSFANPLGRQNRDLLMMAAAALLAATAAMGLALAVQRRGALK